MSSIPRVLATVFEVVIEAKVYQVEGRALQRIASQREKLRGPNGHLFSQRPTLEP